jgi:hypothetical protein
VRKKQPKKSAVKQRLPRGWTEEKIVELREQYENQTKEEQEAEHATAYSSNEPRVRDAADMLVESTVSITIVIADRSFVAQAATVAEQVTKRDAIHLGFTPGRMHPETTDSIPQRLIESELLPSNRHQERRGCISLGHGLKTEESLGGDGFVRSPIRDSESARPDDGLVINQGDCSSRHSVVLQERGNFAL